MPYKLNLRQILPLAYSWVQRESNRILDEGIPLTTLQIHDAELAGINEPLRIRILHVNTIPIPDHPILREACRETNLLSQNTTGLTLYYGIFIRNDCRENRKLLVHEFVHVAQYEMRGIQGFLQDYIQGVSYHGYPQAPMEQEAVSRAEEICSK